MTSYAAWSFVSLTAVSAALFAAYFLWPPVTEAVRARVDAFLKIAASHTREAHGEAANRYKWMKLAKRLFMFGMPRTWGVETAPWTLLLAAAGLGAIAAFAVHALIGLGPWPSLPAGLLAAWLGPHLICSIEQTRADRRFIDLFPDAIDMIVRMMRAGLPVSASIRTVAREAPAPINKVFTALADQIDIGIPFEDALAIGSDRIGLPDFRFFAAAVALQHSTGGNLVSTLEILSEIIRRRRVVRMKAHAATAEVKISAYILGSLPFGILSSLLYSSPGYLHLLFADPRGKTMLAISAAMLVAAFLIMRGMIHSVITE